MAIILKTKSIYFNDVNIIPSIGKVKSRKDVSDELFRIITSPMLSLTGETFISEASRLGLSSCTPRYITMDKKIKLCNIFEKNKKNNNQVCFLSIGLNEPSEELEKLSHNTNHRNILFDISNGYIPQLEEKIKLVYNEIGTFNNLMIGNVITDIGLQNLISHLDKYCINLFCRIGIGNGKICQSSDSVGVNRGNLTELIECSDLKNNENGVYKNKKLNKRINLVSDGGISKGGHCLKAFGAGSDYVLMGSYFSNSIEAETNVLGENIHFGCASERQNKLAGLNRHSEGKEFRIKKEDLRPLSYFVNELWGGISSGISYVGYKSVSDFIGNGIFEVKQNSLPPKGRI